MKVIAGLGNPGAEYANTPHSIGFEVVDAVAAALGVSWKSSSSFKGELATGLMKGVKVLLVKPQTYMNLSGDCVAPVLKYHNATINDLVVVSDDIDLPAGKMRIRKGGGPGGHNGLKSVIERTGSPDFARLRMGVGRDAHNRANVIGHVLGKFSPDDRKVMDEVVAEAVKAVETITTQNLETAMNRYNGWTAPAAAAPAGEGNK
ncbi:MAG: aminoacyl-tRNA hydrolase [Kiritimatiellae bacterium]|nr:aminoacyl-tRNA hydrolase [Kiritimatiellia bacterium]